jgi:hypothetical protein
MTRRGFGAIGGDSEGGARGLSLTVTCRRASASSLPCTADIHDAATLRGRSRARRIMRRVACLISSAARPLSDVFDG